MPRFVSLMIASLWLVATHAAAVVLCARPRADGTFNTTVKLRESCHATEMQLDPVALGLQGPEGPQGPPGVVDPSLVYLRSATISVAMSTCDCATQSCDSAN